MTFVFNASPLIVLAKARLLDRLLVMATRFCVPQQVAVEIERVNDPHDAAKLWIRDRNNLAAICSAPSVPSFIMAWDLGSGESGVISLAETFPRAVAILDDMAARRCAQAVGVRVMGTLGLILMAKRRGIIPEVNEALDAVVAAGLFVSASQIAAIRAEAGE